MPRVSGVDIPENKRTLISLTYIHGIGKTFAKQICDELGWDPDRKVKELTDEEVSELNAHIQNNYMVEGTLRRQIQQNIQRLKDIHSWRGLRHRRGLPVRGQRTQCNARTRKGPKKTVAGKKGVKG
jgi:small subunit ribosomal protein S13